MLRQGSCVALAALLWFEWAGPLAAQAPSNSPTAPIPANQGQYPSQNQNQAPAPPPSLAQRLEQFRQDLLGDPHAPKKQRYLPPVNQQQQQPQQLPQQQQQPQQGRPWMTQQGGGRPPAQMPANPAMQNMNSNAGQAASPPMMSAPQPVVAAPRSEPAAEAGAVVDNDPSPEPTPAEFTPRPPALMPQAARRARGGSTFNAVPIDAAPSPAERDRPLARRDEERPIDEPASEPEAEPSRSEVVPLQSDPPSLRTARSERPSAVPLGEDPAPPVNKRVTGDSVLMTGASPQLVVETSGPRKVLIGKEAVFVLKIRNAGEGAASNVAVQINVPNYVEVLSMQPSSGNLRGSSGPVLSEPTEWFINRMEPRGRETLTLRLVPRKSAPIDLGVQWTCSAESSQTVVEVQEPRLLMSLAGPGEILYGQSKIYKLTLTNPGNGDAENVTVALLPMGRSNDAPTSHRIGTLKSGQSKTIEIELTARQAGTLSIKAEATADGGLHADAAEQVIVRRAALKIEVLGPKAKFAGTPATYRIQIVNPGNATAESVQLSALLPPQAKYLSASPGARVDSTPGKVTWSLGALQAGAERTVDVHCLLQVPGDNRLQVAATGADDLASLAVVNTRVDAVADLKLEVRDPQGPVSINDEAMYELVLRNRGTKSAEGIELVVFFSEGLEATACHGHPHQIERGQVVFKTIPSLAAGSEMIVRVNARADVPGNHVFRAEVACHAPLAKLAAEETTLFYGEDNPEKPPRMREAAPLEPLQPLQPLDGRN